VSEKCVKTTELVSDLIWHLPKDHTQKAWSMLTLFTDLLLLHEVLLYVELLLTRL
jgi:hypothetical protein